MRLKKILKKACIITTLSLAAGSIFYLADSVNKALKNKSNLIFKEDSSSENNVSDKHVIIFTKPDFKAKKLQTIYDHIQLEEIIPFYETDDWIKIGNAENGDVGWINKEKLNKFYDHLRKNKIIEKYYEGDPKVTVKHSPDGRYIVKETNGVKNGVRFRITEERYVIEGSTISGTIINNNDPMYENDVSKEELKSAMDELDYIQQYQ